MIFKQWAQVLGGTKTQTRRPVKPDEYGVAADYDGCSYLSVVRRERHALKWYVGCTYAVQPDRGKKAVGRIRITKIRRERLQDITWQDCIAEGMKYYSLLGTNKPDSAEIYCGFILLWEDIYGNGAWDRMKDDDVWALDFERSEG